MSRDGNLRTLFRSHLRRVNWTSVETGGTGRGIPDSHGCHEGAAFWVEFKGTSGLVVPLSPEQAAWHSAYARAGGRSFVAIRRQCPSGPRRGPAKDELHLVRGEAAAFLLQHGLPGPAGSLVTDGGPRRWSWDDVLAFLTSR